MKASFTLKGLNFEFEGQGVAKVDELEFEFECEAGEYKEVLSIVKELVAEIKNQG